ncbi:hypothetical protein H8E77_33485 [bacterium]|nr:hypothetical protein [bacterium]
MHRIEESYDRHVSQIVWMKSGDGKIPTRLKNKIAMLQHKIAEGTGHQIRTFGYEFAQYLY